MQNKLKLGSLGSPNTFGAEAAQRMLEEYTLFDEIVYFASTEDAMRFEGCDALCAPQQMSKTGTHARMQSRVAVRGSKLHVIAEVTHAYHCSLLIKPGAPADGIRRVLGHTGSVTQSRDWIEAHLPKARIEIVETSSMGAAQEVAGGDGSIASIGTPGMAREFDLEQFGTDIDGHSIGSYWALSPTPIFSDRPNRLVVAGRFGAGGSLSRLIASVLDAGFNAQSFFPMAAGTRLYEYDYAISFGGSGSLEDVQRAIAKFHEARLAGAYQTRDEIGS
jgi:prephenate dehydratase